MECDFGQVHPYQVEDGPHWLLIHSNKGEVAISIMRCHTISGSKRLVIEEGVYELEWVDGYHQYYNALFCLCMLGHPHHPMWQGGE